MSTDELFEKIIQDALSKACGVECGIEEFISQLKNFKDHIDIQIESSECDLRRQMDDA